MGQREEEKCSQFIEVLTGTLGILTHKGQHAKESTIGVCN